MVENWTLRRRPVPRLERRIEFDDYDTTRDFLDLAAELSEREGYYPDMNFGRTHVSMTISSDEESGEFEAAALSFAEKLNGFAPTNKITTPLDPEYFVEGKD